MIRSILSVGGWTLVSRATGFLRDVLMAAVMGAGPIADAFVVAFRLPNHFRAIFGEGAFNVAFVPTYAALDAEDGAARAFADRVYTLMLLVQVALLALALPLMPVIVRALAPGFADEPEKFALAVTLTRITFPYLLFITQVTLLSGILNARRRFAAAAAAPVLLNVSLLGALALAFLFRMPATPQPGASPCPACCNSCWSGPMRGGPGSPRPGAPDPERCRHAPVLRDARTGSDRLGRRADRDVRRHDHRLVSCRPARSRRSTMPTGSISYPSGSSASPPARCCCRR